MGEKARLIIGLSGASGVVYGVRLLKMLRPMAVETHLVMTRAAEVTLAHETDLRVQDVRGLADEVHGIADLAAPISSGSYKTLGMIVAPCSIKSLSAIASSYDDTLIARAADVCLKERRRLVLLVRETPLHLGHLRVLTQLAEMGAVILPPMPAFYNRPKQIDEIVDHTLARVLDRLRLPQSLVPEWGVHPPAPPAAGGPPSAG